MMKSNAVAISFLFLALLIVPFSPITTAQRTSKDSPKIYSYHVHSVIRSRFAKTTVISRVVNPSSSSQETEFLVTLPEAAFISSFIMEIDGRNITGEIKEKDIAQKIYDRDKKKGKTGGQVKAKPRDTNKFTISINLAPAAKVNFYLTYEELLKRSSGFYQNQINLNPGQVVPDFSVRIDIEESRPISALKVPPLKKSDDLSKFDSESENTAVEIQKISDQEAVVRYEPTEEMQRDEAKEGLSAQLLVLYDVERSKNKGEIQLVNGYFVHYFAPKDLTPLRKHVVFVLDRSGSMVGVKMKQMKTAMKTILKDLDDGDYVSIYHFSDSVSVWKRGAVKMTPAVRKTLSNYIRSNEPISARGGTNIRDALAAALKDVDEFDAAEENVASVIVFLTDGQPTVGEVNLNKIITQIKQKNTKIGAPFYSLAFGTGADYNFLQKLSLQNNGFARKIYEASDAALQLEGFYKEISSPLLQNVTFTYPADVGVADVTETDFYNFFDGTEIVVAGRLPKGAGDGIRANVMGVGAAGETDFEDAANVVEQDDGLGQIMERAWAFLFIKQLHKKYQSLDYKGQEKEKEDIKNQITALALKYNFVTPFTSLVVTQFDEDQILQEAKDDPSRSGLRRSRLPLVGSRAKSISSSKPTLTRYGARRGFGSGRGFADNDPHFVIAVKGLTRPVCFDVHGRVDDVFRLLEDEARRIFVNGIVIPSGIRNKMTGTPNTYFGRITISFGSHHLNVSPEIITVGRWQISWKERLPMRLGNVALKVERGKFLYVGIDDFIKFVVVRSSVAVNPRRLQGQRQRRPQETRQKRRRIHFLGFYVEDGRGLSLNVHGLIGQFMNRLVTLEEQRQPEDEAQQPLRHRQPHQTQPHERRHHRVAGRGGRDDVEDNEATNADDALADSGFVSRRFPASLSSRSASSDPSSIPGLLLAAASTTALPSSSSSPSPSHPPRLPRYALLTSNRRVPTFSGRRRNILTDSRVKCWFVRNDGRGLIDGRTRDYLVDSLEDFRSIRRRFLMVGGGTVFDKEGYGGMSRSDQRKEIMASIAGSSRERVDGHRVVEAGRSVTKGQYEEDKLSKLEDAVTESRADTHNKRFKVVEEVADIKGDKDDGVINNRDEAPLVFSVRIGKTHRV